MINMVSLTRTNEDNDGITTSEFGFDCSELTNAPTEMELNVCDVLLSEGV